MYRIKGVIYQDGKKLNVEEILGPRFAMNYADAIGVMKEFDIKYYCIYLERVI